MKHRTEVKVIYVDAIYGLVEDGRFSDSIRNLSVVLMVGCGNNEKITAILREKCAPHHGKEGKKTKPLDFGSPQNPPETNEDFKPPKTCLYEGCGFPIFFLFRTS